MTYQITYTKRFEKHLKALRNYTSVVKEVSYGNRVYLTKNGHGTIAMLDMKELDEMEKQIALLKFQVAMKEAEKSIDYWRE